LEFLRANSSKRIAAELRCHINTVRTEKVGRLPAQLRLGAEALNERPRLAYRSSCCLNVAVANLALAHS